MMARIKLTKGELKRQRDALVQYMRYLPTLQLKKQQLQMEILRQQAILDEKRNLYAKRLNAAYSWAGLLARPEVELSGLLKPKDVERSTRNIAGIEIPVFEKAEFGSADYDLFTVPLWVDAAVEELRQIISLGTETGVLEEGINILRRALRVTAQRVNLFEKVKIPLAEDAIRSIKIYIGDQMTNAVGRSKIAKRKIEALETAGVA